MTPTLTLLPALELTLWRAETRFDRALMDATFAADFHEFGRSGRTYTRAEMLLDAASREDIDATLHHLTSRPLSDTIAHVTYISEVRHPEGTEWANRSSLWDLSTGAWQLRFHQGTARKAPL